MVNTNPLVLPLGENGGRTATHALAPGSPAIDAGGDECVPTDQRGVPRPQDGDGDGIALCDIGAVESGSLQVQIDIKPDSFPNSVNPRSMGVIPVAILGNEGLDVIDLDLTTLRFGSNQAAPAHGLTDPFVYNDHLQDVNLDGYMDLVTHYNTRDTGIACGDESATLTGELLDGQPFEGSDSIRTVGCRKFGQPSIWLKDDERPSQPRDGTVVDVEGN